MSGEVSARDRAHRGYTLFLTRIGHVKAGDVAKAMGISDAAVSETKTKKVEDAILLLAHLGIKCVSTEFRCVEPATFEFMAAASKTLINRAPQLLWDEEGHS